MKSFILNGMFVLLCMCCISGGVTEDPNHATKPYSFVFEDLDGNTVNLDEMYDKTVFLNFWATSCGPCIREMPSMAKAKKALSDTNYIFCVVSDEHPKNLMDFKRKNKSKYPFEYLYSPNNKRKFDVNFLPHTYVLKNGMILATYKGAYDWAESANIEMLRAMAH